jgi:hypothetical protein
MSKPCLSYAYADANDEQGKDSSDCYHFHNRLLKAHIENVNMAKPCLEFDQGDTGKGSGRGAPPAHGFGFVVFACEGATKTGQRHSRNAVCSVTYFTRSR